MSSNVLSNTGYDVNRESSPVISNHRKSKRVLEPLKNAPPNPLGTESEGGTTNPQFEGGVPSISTNKDLSKSINMNGPNNMEMIREDQDY